MSLGISYDTTFDDIPERWVDPYKQLLNNPSEVADMARACLVGASSVLVANSRDTFWEAKHAILADYLRGAGTRLDENKYNQLEFAHGILSFLGSIEIISRGIKRPRETEHYIVRHVVPADTREKRKIIAREISGDSCDGGLQSSPVLGLTYVYTYNREGKITTETIGMSAPYYAGDADNSTPDDLPYDVAVTGHHTGGIVIKSVTDGTTEISTSPGALILEEATRTSFFVPRPSGPLAPSAGPSQWAKAFSALRVGGP